MCVGLFFAYFLDREWFVRIVRENGSCFTCENGSCLTCYVSGSCLTFEYVTCERIVFTNEHLTFRVDISWFVFQV